jgi:hypothetical protein
MYGRCLFCSARLGRNDLVEEFPVGRILAFDAERGRLWVLCGRCRGWNLAPIEERWEAMEALERRFRRAAEGASTEHIALRRADDGTRMVRIGRAAPQLEVAGWRYGEMIRRRWRLSRNAALTYGGLGAGASALMGTLGLLPAYGVMVVAGLALEQRTLLRVADGRKVSHWDRFRAHLLPSENATGWALQIRRRRVEPMVLEEYDAIRAVRAFLRTDGEFRGSRDHVRNAIEELQRLGSAHRVFVESASELASSEAMDARYRWISRPHQLRYAHPVILLALEMAADEEAERIAMEAEVTLLQREWRDAEEIASIADALTFPARSANRRTEG